MKKLAVANGQYTNSVGQVKTRWVNVGVIGTAQNGKEFMLIDPTINFAAFPREDGKDMVMVGMFEEDQQQQQPQQGYQQQGYQQPPQQQGYVPPPTVQEYRNSQGQLTDEHGNVLPQQ